MNTLRLARNVFAAIMTSTTDEIPLSRSYQRVHELKYGVNPHQKPAALLADVNGTFPFKVINGKPGYINVLDALNAWQLVHELRDATGLPSAASFKHVSPAGAAVAVPLDAATAAVYDVAADANLPPLAIAYIRARQTDPKCSFGDFAALSDTVDADTARFIGREVSDGIIAPGYTPEALTILAAKKGGAYIVLQADKDYVPPAIEYREVFGCVFAQRRNDMRITADAFKEIVTTNKHLPQNAVTDLLVASITAKYTQSNSVVYAFNGQTIGVGAGQQSRVDCVKLAGAKAETWWLRQAPAVTQLHFKPTVKRTERVNARIAYIDGDMTDVESAEWAKQFESVPQALSADERRQWLSKLTGVSVSSDAFFPFRDNIDQCSRRGVSYIAQAGGSNNDAQVTEAANQYNMTMAKTNIRLFHH